LGDAPDYMAEDAQTAWSELEAYSLSGVLTDSDRFTVEINVFLLAQYRAEVGSLIVKAAQGMVDELELAGRLRNWQAP
jgi:hypothetical protein